MSPRLHPSDLPVQFDEYEILGRRVLVGAPGPRPLDDLRRLLCGFGPRALSGDPLPTYQLTIVAGRWHACTGDLVLPLDQDFHSALTMLEWHVVNDTLRVRDDLIHLHGAALEAPSGGGLVLLGQSGSGKSTLTLSLIARGFRPFADDLALVHPRTLALTPFRRAFHAEPETARLVEGVVGRPSAVREVIPGHVTPAEWASGAGAVRWLLVVERSPEAAAAIASLAPVDAARDIVAHALNLDRVPALVMHGCAQVTARAHCYRLVNGALPESVEAIERVVAATTRSIVRGGGRSG